MAITFKITKAPEIATMKVDGDLVILNHDYPIELQDTIEIINDDASYRGEPLTSFNYKIKLNDIESSNEGTVLINFLVDTESPTANIDLIEDINLYDYFYIGDLISVDKGFDRIFITDIIGHGTWKLNSELLVIGNMYMFSDFVNVIFNANTVGPKLDYNILKFNFGDKNGPYIDESTITTNVSNSPVFILNPSEPIITIPNIDGITESTSFDTIVEYGISEIIQPRLTIEIDTAEFIDFGTDPNNTIDITANGDTTNYASNNFTGVVRFDTNILEDGTASIFITVNRTTYAGGDIVLPTALIVMSDGAIIDPLKSQINLTIPIAE